MFTLYSVSYTFQDGVTLFKYLNLHIHRNTITILTGPNGGGKTSFCRLLTGLMPDYKGTIKKQEEAVFLKQDIIGNILGINFEDDLSIWQNKFQEKDDTDKQKDRSDMLSYFYIADKQFVPFWLLSTGQKRSGMLSALLMMMDRYWILDEPTGSLDKQKKEILIDVIQKKKEKGCGALITTHQPEVFSDVADTYLHIQDKEIIEISYN